MYVVNGDVEASLIRLLIKETVLDKPATVSPSFVNREVLLVTLPSTSFRVEVMFCSWTAMSSTVGGMVAMLEGMVVVAQGMVGCWWLGLVA
jgi:hypothetical protein